MKINLADYLSFSEGKNTTPAIAAAFSALKDGDTLYLGGGKYELYAAGAVEKEYYISNNDFGVKPIAFPLIGMNNVTVDGEGAELIFHGRVLPFCVDGSTGITIKNVIVDYASPFYAQALIEEADEEHIVMQFDNREFFCRVGENGEFVFSGENNDNTGLAYWEDKVEECLTLEFDPDKKPSAYKPPYFPYTGKPKDHGFLGGMFRDVKLKDFGGGKIGMYGRLGFTHTVGSYWLCTHSSREFPGVFITDSKDVKVENVTLYHTASMGVIGQISENITLDGVRAVVREGTDRMLSTNADATHFVNCRGKLTITNSKFVSMMDDAMNIHGIYNPVIKNDGDKSYRLGFGHFQQKGIQIYRPGDEIAVIDKYTMKTLCRANVVSAELISPDEVLLETDKVLPLIDEIGADKLVTENLSTAPEVYISGCETGNNRPRGFLISSSAGVLVENNIFYNMNQGIQLGGEMKDWYECGETHDVTIRNNEFRNSAYAGGCAIHFNMNLYNNEIEDYYHGKVVVEGNTFTQQDKRFMYASHAREVIFRNNTFIRDESLPAHGRCGKNGIIISHCGKVESDI